MSLSLFLKKFLQLKGSFQILIHTYIYIYIFDTSIVGARGFESWIELRNTKNYKLSYKTLDNSS